MKVFFLRHGEAAHNIDDDIRPLTHAGMADVAAVAGRHADELSAVQTVLVSPILRAQQTAQAAFQAIGREPHWQTVDWLIHETPVREALAELADLESDSIWLIGHQPLASLLVERLCGQRLAIGTANLVALEGEAAAPGFMSLSAFVQP